VVLLATAGLLVLNVSLAAFTLEDDNKLLLDLGLSTLLLSGLFLSAFSATGVLSREIEDRTVLTVISKPISRPVFFLGKFLGLLAAVLLAYYLSALVFVLAQRHGVLQNSSDPWDAPVLVLGCTSVGIALLAAAFANYFYGKHFGAAAITFVTPLLTVAVLAVGFFDKHFAPVAFGSKYVGGQVLIAAYLVMLAVIVTSAVALAASTRFKQVMTLLICTFVVGVGIASDWIFGQYTATSFAASIAYHIVPNIGPFWVIDGLHAASEETAVPVQYALLASAYALLITAATVGVGIAALQKREVG